jgi:hypothetical protein
MIYEVEMHAFGRHATPDGAVPIRRVTVPDAYAAEPGLGPIFQFGQNDFCSDEDRAQGLPSVSVGDIIRVGRHRWVVMPSGFREVAADFAPPADDRGGFYAYELAAPEAR